MRYFYKFLLTTAVAFLSFPYLNAQKCDVDLIVDTNAVCKGTQVTAIASFFDTVTTTFADNNGQDGNMFDIVAKNDITIRAFDIHPENTTNVSVYYKKGSYRNTERDSTKWTLVGRKFGVTAQSNGTPTQLDLFFKVDIDSGETFSFYVTSTTTNILNYTNGTTEYSVYASDRNLSVLEGLGVAWPFGDGPTGGIFRPRIFNGNIIYEVQGTKTYEWSNNMKGDTITFTADKNFTLTLEGKTGSCTSYDSVKFEVEDLNVNLGNDTFLCDGTSIQLDASKGPNGTNYNWKPSGGQRFKLISSGGQKSVTVVTPLGCRYRDTIFITDKPSPNVALGSDIDLCDGDSIAIDAGNFGSLAKYSWNTQDTTRAITANSAGRYVVTVTDSFGCEGKDNIEITMRQNPSIDLGADQEVCEGDNITLDADYSDNNTTYQWNTNESTKNITITNTGGYKVMVTSEYGCKGDDSVYYFFHGAPRSGMEMMQEACRGDEVVLDAGNHGPNSKYDWSTSETSREIKVSTNGTYAVIITDSFGCQNEEIIDVNFRKLPSVNLGRDLNFCDGNTEVIDAGFDDGYTSYLWSTTDTTKTLEVGATGTYSVLVTDSFGCENSDEIDVLVLDLPEFDWEGDTAICTGETVELDPGNHDKYNWSTNENTRTITVGAGTYSVVITNVFGCKNTDSVEVSIVPSALAAFTGSDIGGQKVAFTNTSSNASAYAWDFGDGNTSTEIEPTHWYKEEGTYTVTLNVENRCGDDENTSSVTVATSSLNEANEVTLLVYPNPTTGNLFVTIPQNAKTASFQVFDMAGKQIPISFYLSNKNTWQVELNPPAKGLYMLKVNTEKGLITQNFMVE